MIKITPQINKSLSDKRAIYWKTRKEPKVKLRWWPVKCINCNRPFSYNKMMNNRLFRITGTARIAGVYKKKGKIVEKAYGHFPSCSALRIRQVVVRI